MLVGEQMRAQSINLGPLTLNDVPVAEDNSALGSEFEQCDAMLGLFALTRLQLIIDRKNGFAYTRPALHPTDDYPYNRIGAVFVPKEIDNANDNDLLARVMQRQP